MSDRMALRIAIDLMHVPSQVRLFRLRPLPDGVPMLLRVAAGDDEAECTASLYVDRSRAIVRQAAAFFIEQILFAPDADSYRVLGACPDASAGELRRNVALLLRWLHPDVDGASERSVFVGRVTAAWNDVKTPERRATYDNQLGHSRKRTRTRFKGGRFRPGSAADASKRYFNAESQRLRNSRLLGRAVWIGLFRRVFFFLFYRTRY